MLDSAVFTTGLAVSKRLICTTRLRSRFNINHGIAHFEVFYDRSAAVEQQTFASLVSSYLRALLKIPTRRIRRKRQRLLRTRRDGKEGSYQKETQHTSQNNGSGHGRSARNTGASMQTAPVADCEQG
jgi:hypothetical protein